MLQLRVEWEDIFLSCRNQALMCEARESSFYSPNHLAPPDKLFSTRKWKMKMAFGVALHMAASKSAERSRSTAGAGAHKPQPSIAALIPGRRRARWSLTLKSMPQNPVALLWVRGAHATASSKIQNFHLAPHEGHSTTLHAPSAQVATGFFRCKIKR